MEVAESLLEILKALYWDLGSDLTREVAVDWFLGEGQIQRGVRDDGQPIYLDVTPEALNHLAKLGLIVAKDKAGPSSERSLGHKSHTTVRFLPTALEVPGLKSDMTPSTADNVRYAQIRIDTHKFTEMLKESFSTDELKDLVLELGVEYENVVPSNATKSESARTLVEYMRRNSRLMDLWCAATRQRSNRGWNELLSG